MSGRRLTAAKISALSGRVASALIVVSAAVWLGLTLGARRTDSLIFLRPVADRMMAGEVYDPSILAAMDEDLSGIVTDSLCDFQALQDLTVVRGALAETAFQANDPQVAYERLARVEEAARATLSCSPGSAVAWTVLAWVEHIRNEDTPRLRSYLGQSRKFGPLEGWPMVRRMELLLALYPGLDVEELADLRRSVMWISGSGLSEFIGEHYISGGENQRRALTEILSQTPEREQKMVAQFIRNNGDDISLPFVEPLGSRPWK